MLNKLKKKKTVWLSIPKRFTTWPFTKFDNPSSIGPRLQIELYFQKPISQHRNTKTDHSNRLKEKNVNVFL